MKVIIPENISEITLEQFQKINNILKQEGITERQIEDKTIEIFYNIPTKDVNNITEKDRTYLLKMVKDAMERDVPFVNTFTLNDVAYGFHPNLDKLTGWEFLDVKQYEKDVQDYHKLMAVLFRPIKNKDSFGNYEIENYDGTKDRAELFKSMPMNVVNGALGFFLTLSNDLQTTIKRYIHLHQAKGMRQYHSLPSGDGTQPLKV